MWWPVSPSLSSLCRVQTDQTDPTEGVKRDGGTETVNSDRRRMMRPLADKSMKINKDGKGRSREDEGKKNDAAEGGAPFLQPPHPPAKKNPPKNNKKQKTKPVS